MEIFLIILGALLAIGGGFAQQCHSDKKAQKRNDRNALISALECISALTLPARRSIIGRMARNLDEALEHIYTRHEREDVYKSNLYVLSFKIQRNENEEIARKIREFALGPGTQGIRELKKEIEKRLNERGKE